ncbi:hypothetical protein LY76DRAFT_650964, partial [Colletotrichum caudatum]
MIVPRFDTIFTVGAAIAANVALAAPAVQPGLDARDLAENEAFMAEGYTAFIERRDDADDDWRRRRRRFGDVEADDGKKKGFDEGWFRDSSDFIERRDDSDDDWRRRRRRFGQAEVDDGKKKDDVDDGKKKKDVDDGKKKE